MADANTVAALEAEQHFRLARHKAIFGQLWGRLLGRSVALYAFEDVRSKLKGRVLPRRELREIPLDAIVGSVGRYDDFTRGFLPRTDASRERWKNVDVRSGSAIGLPPIDVYQIGDGYFVLDGNHRVSVAHARGLTHIEAYVTPVETKVPFAADDSVDDLIRKAELAEFLELTDLDRLRPATDFATSLPGQHRQLLRQIETHRYHLEQEAGASVSYDEAVRRWHDDIYRPIADFLNARGLLHGFPGRTTTDLYTWIFRHQAELKDATGWTLTPESIALQLAEAHGAQPARTPVSLEQQLFSDVLVALDGSEAGWQAVDQALYIVQRTGARLYGLHVQQDGAATVEAVADEFARRTAAAGITAELAFETGTVSAILLARAPLMDLIVISLRHPPGAGPLARLSSGMRRLVAQCPCPLLAVPRQAVAMARALVAYDGSGQAQQALFVAAYMAARWAIELVVVTVVEPETSAALSLAAAEHYLDRLGIAADGRVLQGEPADAIVAAARDTDCDLIVMGGYSHSGPRSVVSASTVDAVLRTRNRPVLICP